MISVRKVGLLAIGNELLTGIVRETNLFFLSEQLTLMGFEVACTLVVRDVPAMIVAAMWFLLEQHFDLVVCSGGLGPTADDLTLSALAKALDLPLLVNREALDLVERHYAHLITAGQLSQLGPESARRKMATLPQGAAPLANPAGIAPGVKLSYADTLIYALPGVPEELRAIFSSIIVPELRCLFTLPVRVERALLVHCVDEAAIASQLREVAAAYPDVYLKSLARPFSEGTEDGMRVIAAAHGEDFSLALLAVNAVLEDLRKRLERAGFQVVTASHLEDF